MSQIIYVAVACGFHALDMVSGLIAAIKTGDLQSSKMRDGLFKKLGFILCYVLAILVDTYGAEIGFAINVKILPAIVLYAVGTEIVSVLENVGKINADLLSDTLRRIFHIGGDE